MKRLAVHLFALALVFTCSVSAYALEVPTDTVVQNLNGSQQAIKTFTIDAGADPQELIEEPFELEGYLYTFADITKTENHVEDIKSHTETVTVETEKKDLSVVLEHLPPVMEYDDGTYSGTLSLDHTTIRTEAAGYASGSKTVTATKTIGPLDRNDMSYVPATTVKDGRTLNLSHVDWQVIGTGLVGETLVPSSYQALATYSGKASYSYATGYITTAEYVGEITRDGVESITYRLTYLGEKGAKAGGNQGEATLSGVAAALSATWPYLLAGGGLLTAAGLTVALVRSRREAAQLREGLEMLPGAEEKEEEE